MVNIVKCYISMLHMLMKLVGIQSVEVEIEPGTIMHFWVNNNDNTNNKKKNKKLPIVLLHGFAGNGILTWQFQVLALCKKHPLFVPDLLFFGGSYTNKAERTPRFQAECVAKGLRKLGVKEKCVVVGFSYGGFVGFQMAEHHPELVDSLVVTGATLALSKSISDNALKRIGFSSWVDFLMPTSVVGIKVLLDIGSYSLPWMPNFFYKHYLEVMFSYRKERSELLEALVVKDEDVTSHKFQQRIHVIWGKEDSIFNMDVANTLKDTMKGTIELQVVKKAGHLVLLERPFAFNKRLKNCYTDS